MSDTQKSIEDKLVTTGMHSECAQTVVGWMREAENPSAGKHTKKAFTRAAKRLTDKCRKRECELS